MLRAAGIGQPRAEARALLARAMAVPEETLLRDPRAGVPEAAGRAFEALLARRASREPLQLLLGEAGFWTLTLEVSRDTLIPRADSEALIEAALAALPECDAVRRVLDLGTGTGCLLLAALAEFPRAFGIGVDRAPAAAALAARNAARNGLSGRAAFVAGEWGRALAAPFDLVLGNPPYIESGDIAGLMPEVSRHEPRLALDGGADGLDAYRAICADLLRLLAPGGVAVLELGQGQAGPVAALAAGQGLRQVALRADCGGVPRALVLAKAIGGGAQSA